jgi:hypothetical protein
MRNLSVLFVMTTAVLLPWQTADAATTRWVGDCGHVASYATIQAAIAAASAGDTINVCPGVYTENVTINKAGLTVVSTGGAAVTRIVAPSVPVFPVVTITHPYVTLVGFTLAPVNSDIGVHVAIQGNASAEIAHNVIRAGRIGVNLGCGSSGSTVYHNIVTGATDSGINIDTCENSDPLAGSRFNSVHHNTVCGGTVTGSIALDEGSDFNDVHYNIGTWIKVVGDGNLVHHNTARMFNISPGDPANVTFSNAAAVVCQ